MYKVKQSDLVGDIEGFPIEVVQRMVECQVERGIKAAVSILQGYARSGTISGDFFWCDTKEGHDFWWKVIVNRDFNLFFKKYPKGKE